MGERAKKKLSDAQVEQIVEYGDQGKSGHWIALKMNLSPLTVNWRLLSNGIDPWPGKSQEITKNHRGKFTPEDDAKMLELGRSGMSIQKIADTMGRRYSSIRVRIMTLEIRAEKHLDAA